MTLASALRARGYRGLALPGDPLLHSASGLARGFDRYVASSPGFGDSARVDSALAWIARSGARFVWLDLSFGAPAAVWRRMDGIGPHDSSARAARARDLDGALAHLIVGLRAARLADSTVIAVVGTGAATTSADEPCSVPLVIAGPGLRAGRDVGTRATLLDVAPTLAALAGGKLANAPGHDLRAPAAAVRMRCDLDLHRTLGGPDVSDSLLERRRVLREALAEVAGLSDSAAADRWTSWAARYSDSPRIVLEWAVASSRAGREIGSAKTFKDLIAKHPDYYEAAVAYAEHMIRHHRYTIVRETVAPLPPGSPLVAVAEWRQVAAMAAARDVRNASAAADRASQLAVLDPTKLEAAARLASLVTMRDSIGTTADSLAVQIRYALALADFGMLDAAFEQLHTARFRNPGSAEPDYWIAVLLIRQNRPQHAIPTLQRGLGADRDHRPSLILLAELLLEAGNRSEARKVLERAAATGPLDARDEFNLACLLATDGERDAALGALEQAVARGYDDWTSIAQDPDLASLREQPRYRELLERHRR